MIWYLTTAVICSPQILTKRNIWRFIGICWTFGVYLLHNLFASDMFTSMTLAPELDVVDSLTDLALKTTGPITAFAETDHFDVNKYFSPKQDFRKELSNRLKILDVEFAFNLDFAVEVIYNVTNREQHHLESKDMLEFYKNTLFTGRFKESLYISKESGNPVPLFICLGPKIDFIVFETFNNM